MNRNAANTQDSEKVFSSVFPLIPYVLWTNAAMKYTWRKSVLLKSELYFISRKAYCCVQWKSLAIIRYVE